MRSCGLAVHAPHSSFLCFCLPSSVFRLKKHIVSGKKLIEYHMDFYCFTIKIRMFSTLIFMFCRFSYISQLCVIINDGI